MPRLCDQGSTNQIRLLKKNNEKSICQKTKHSSRVSEGIYRQSYIRHRGRYLAFSLAVDKSTDNTDTVQLAIFIWGVKADVCLSRGALSCSFNAWDEDREGPVWWKRLLGRINIGQKWGGCHKPLITLLHHPSRSFVWIVCTETCHTIHRS